VTNAEREELALDEVGAVINGSLTILDELAEIAKRREVMINISVTPFDQRASVDAEESNG
jgi:hypothetical protein